MKSLPSRQYLNTILSYDPATGELTWKSRPLSHFKDQRGCSTWNTMFAGKPAFTATDRKGYRVGAINNEGQRAHRVIYMLMTGSDPDQIDHIDGDPSNNRWTNLRSLPGGLNQKNMKRPRNNQSGHIGVFWREDKQRWLAYITSDKKRINLGHFEDINDAIAARKQAEIDHGFHPNHGR